jgi:hypothetical protein
MKPKTSTITELFELDTRYVVPLYQRPYVWGREKQWEPLWDDLETLLDHQESGSGQSYSHFLGAVVIDQEMHSPGEIPVFTVIDGQQRLTTLQILLAASTTVATERGATKDAAIMRDLVTNNPMKAQGNELFKVWPTNRDRKAFEAVMAEGGPTADRIDDPDNHIDEAYAFFVQKVRHWLDESDLPDDERRIKLLRITLCDLLKVVSITLEPGDNAQVIFETLNARGTPLLALDLVKNSLFHSASQQNLEVDALHEEVWQPVFDDDYWREDQRQGRIFRPRAELFLMHWLAMKLQRPIPATELFSVFRAQVLQTVPPPATDALIRELCADAKVMRSFDSLPVGSREALFFSRLAVLDTTTVLPLILFIFRESSIDANTRRRCLETIESWLTRRMLVGMTAKNYNKHFHAILGRIIREPSRSDQILVEEFLSSEADISIWPSDDMVTDRLTTHRLYGYISQAKIVMVLSAVEMSMYSSKTDAVTINSALSVEHVMPQEWAEHWPLPATATLDEAGKLETERNQRIHNLGNLTLVTGPLNSGMQNGPWNEKQQALNSESVLRLNQQLVAQFPERFDDKSIDARGADLARVICTIWPIAGQADPNT